MIDIEETRELIRNTEDVPALQKIEQSILDSYEEHQIDQNSARKNLVADFNEALPALHAKRDQIVKNFRPEGKVGTQDSERSMMSEILALEAPFRDKKQALSDNNDGSDLLRLLRACRNRIDSIAGAPERIPGPKRSAR